MLKLENAIRKELRPYGDRKRWMYLFNCIDCSKKIWYEEANLVKQQGRCLICAAKINVVKAQRANKKRPFEAIYNRLAKSALNRHLSFTITFEDFLEFTQEKRCHYCESPHLLVKTHRRRQEPSC